MSLTKDKEFFQYVEKIDWQKAAPLVKGPQDLRACGGATLFQAKELTAAAQWASESKTASWSLKIEDSRYAETPAFLEISEPQGAGFKLSSGALQISLKEKQKAKIYLSFQSEEIQTTENILALQVHVKVASHAELELFIVQNQNVKNSHVFDLNAELDENANLKIYHVTGGSIWSESSYHFVQNGERSRSDLKVLQLGTNGQKHRIWANSYLNKSYTETSQLVKCLLNGQAKNHFIGRIHIAENITEVNAFQRNQNLLLSRQAQALNQPELEVLSDNVKAAHGSATGFMNQDELFYLQSRGMTELEGRKFLAEAFGLAIFSELEESMRMKAMKTLKARIADVCS